MYLFKLFIICAGDQTQEFHISKASVPIILKILIPGPLRWLSGSRHLLLSMGTSVQIPRPTRWKVRTNSSKFSPDLHIYTDIHTHTKKKNLILRTSFLLMYNLYKQPEGNLCGISVCLQSACWLPKEGRDLPLVAESSGDITEKTGDFWIVLHFGLLD